MDAAGLVCGVSSLIRFPVNRQENRSQSSGESTSGQGFKERSPAAAQTPFVPGRCPIFSGRWRTAYIHFLLLERKRVSVPLSRLMSFRPGGPLSLPSGLSSASSLAGGTSPILPPAPPFLFLHPPAQLVGLIPSSVPQAIGSCSPPPRCQRAKSTPPLMSSAHFRFPCRCPS